MTNVGAMSKAERYGETRKGDVAITKEPPPEPIYDLTKADETESIKAAGPGERGDEE
jgi:hypothetical protein